MASNISTNRKLARIYLTIVLILSTVGFFIFLSASLGLAGTNFSGFIKIGLKQFIILIIGGGVMLVTANIPYKVWRKYALPLLIISILGTLLVFVPQLSLEAGGARRWISLGGFSFQPAEILKLGLVFYYGAWLSRSKTKVANFKDGILPLIILLGLAGIILISQPDTGTFLVIASALTAQFLVAGGQWKHILLLGLMGLIGLSGLVLYKPYLKDRIVTFMDPTADELGSAYQINQSLIAIGSGGIAGRGFGQSLQKFNFLPQPSGDSIFAVAGEEFGFIGTVIILMLFLALAITGLKISDKAPDVFGRLTVVGLVILIITQSFANMGAMLGLIPLTGEPLIFISQGGSAILFALSASGIILSIARNKKKLAKT